MIIMVHTSCKHFNSHPLKAIWNRGLKFCGFNIFFLLFFLVICGFDADLLLYIQIYYALVLSKFTINMKDTKLNKQL